MGFDSFLSTRGGIGGIFDTSQDDAMEQLRKNQDLWNSYDPEMLKYEEYNPVVADYRTIEDDPELKSMQLSQLEKMAYMADNGLSDADKASYQLSNMEANRNAKSNRDALLAQAEARGVANGGMSFALQEQANQDAANRAAMAGLQQAGDTARQKALYNQAYGQQLGQVRGQNTDLATKNAAIINAFNQANTQAQNQGRQYNIENRQNVINTNNNAKLKPLTGMYQANLDMAKGYGAQGSARKDERKNDMDTFMSGMKMFGMG
jgi:hypothetical protein